MICVCKCKYLMMEIAKQKALKICIFPITLANCVVDTALCIYLFMFLCNVYIYMYICIKKIINRLINGITLEY